MNYSDDQYTDTWEGAAYRTVLRFELDAPIKGEPDYPKLYENGMFGTLAKYAWSEIRATQEWTIEDMIFLLASKQHDYGHANITKFGSQGVEVRLYDKVARYENLGERVVRGHDVSNESITDTLIDMIGYVIIWHMLKQNEFSLPLEADRTDKENQ